jgi:hypothetical protein
MVIKIGTHISNAADFLVVAILRSICVCGIAKVTVIPYPRAPGDRSNPDFLSVRVDSIVLYLRNGRETDRPAKAAWILSFDVIINSR